MLSIDLICFQIIKMSKNLTVLHKSQHYVVINKEPDIVINTDYPEKHPLTVENQLRNHFPHLVDSKFRFCHRLDYSTSGVICVAISKDAAREASKAFEKRTVEKYYLALLHGYVKDNFLVIDRMIGNDTRTDFCHCMCTFDKIYCSNPKTSLTVLLVLQRGLYNNNVPVTKVIMKPITGRRHQLRVHCQNIGHTIVGDYTYSNRQDIKPHRMFLHSYRLVLPSTLEHIDITTDDPFTSEIDQNRWFPLETVNELDKDIFYKLQYMDTSSIM